MMNLKSCKILCIIPTLNEAITVSEVIRKAKPFVHRVVVVDGHSQDNTFGTALKEGVDVIYQDGKGKGMALRTVLDRFYSDIYVVIDGDATYDAQEMGKIIKPVLEGEADMLIGSRFRGEMERGSISTINKIGNNLLTFLINFFFSGKITDSQSGFRAFKRNVIESFTLSSQGFEIETELTAKTLKRGLKIKEVPITYRKRRGTPSKLSALRAGSRSLMIIMKCYLKKI